MAARWRSRSALDEAYGGTCEGGQRHCPARYFLAHSAPLRFPGGIPEKKGGPQPLPIVLSFGKSPSQPCRILGKAANENASAAEMFEQRGGVGKASEPIK